MDRHYVLIKPVPECDHPFTIYMKSNTASASKRKMLHLREQTNPLLSAAKMLMNLPNDRATAAWLRENLPAAEEYRVTRAYPKCAMSHVYTASKQPLPRMTLADARIICEILTRTFRKRVMLAWAGSEVQYFGDESGDVMAFYVEGSRSLMGLLHETCDFASEILKMASACRT